MNIQTLRCSQKLAGVLQYGIGFNWYDGYDAPEFKERMRQSGYEQDNTLLYPDLEDQDGWARVIEALNDLRPGFIRFGLPTSIDTNTGQFQKDTVHFKRLIKVAKWAAQNDCTILLDTWKIPEYYAFPLPEDVRKAQKWADMAARDNALFAREFVAPLLHYVVEELKLNAVKLYNLVNEPLMYGPFQTPGNKPDAHVQYVNMYKEVISALKKNGLYPDKIKLAGIDCIHAEKFPAFEMLARGIDIDPYLDCYTIHYYFHRFDWMTPVPFLRDTLRESIDRASEQLRRYCTARGKPLLAAEVGWFPQDKEPPFDMEGSSRHFAALITAETIIRGMNVGLAGFAIWSLFNTNNLDGHWRVIAVQNGTLWKTPNLYPIYRLLTRYARPGSEIFSFKPEPAEEPWQYVHATALRTPTSKLVIYAINDHLVMTKPIVFLLPPAWKGRKLDKYIKDDVRSGDSFGEVLMSQKGENAGFEDRLMPMSLTVYIER